MTAIIIPSRRLERPNYPYELDYNHPLVALDRAGARFYDLATLRSTPPGPFTLVGTSHTRKNDYAGPGYGFTTAPGTTSVPIEPYIKPAVSTTKVTVLALGAFGRTLQMEALCSFTYNGTTGYMWNLLKNTADKLRMRCRVGATWYEALSASDLVMGRNYVCAGRYNNSTIDVFLDGRKEGTTSVSGTLSGVNTYFSLLDHNSNDNDTYYNGGNAKYVLVLPNAAAADMLLAEVGRYPWSIVRRKKEVIYTFGAPAALTEAYPIADTSKGAWENSVNLLVGAPTILMPGAYHNEKFNALDWEVDWANPITKNLRVGLGIGRSGYAIATILHPDNSADPILYPPTEVVVSRSPSGKPCVTLPSCNGTGVQVTILLSAVNVDTYFGLSGYASTFLWIGEVGVAGDKKTPLATLYNGGGTYNTGAGIGLDTSLQAYGFMHEFSTGEADSSARKQIRRGAHYAVIATFPQDNTGGGYPKPTLVGGTTGLISKNTSEGAAPKNPSATEFALGNRGDLDSGSGSVTTATYPYFGLLWDVELPDVIANAILQDYRTLFKRRKPAPARVFVPRNYDSSLSLYTQVDDAPTCDTSDFIYTNETSSATLQLSAVDDPASSTGHALTYKARSDTGGDLVVSLQEETAPSTYTTRATRTHNNVPTDWTNYTMTLTTEEADSITDYSKLYVKLDGTP